MPSALPGPSFVPADDCRDQPLRCAHPPQGPGGELRQCRWQVTASRHRRVVNQQRDDRNSAAQSGDYLLADEVSWIVESPPPVLINAGQPSRTD
jgi:hypothetical protein